MFPCRLALKPNNALTRCTRVSKAEYSKGINSNGKYPNLRYIYTFSISIQHSEKAMYGLNMSQIDFVATVRPGKGFSFISLASSWSGATNVEHGMLCWFAHTFFLTVTN